MRKLYDTIEKYALREGSDIIQPVFPRIGQLIKKTPISKTGEKAVIVVPDHTRPLKTSLVLKPILEELSDFKVVKMLFATGTHKMSNKDARSLLDDMDVEYKIHDAWNEDEHVRIGTTKRGFNMFIDKEYVNADVKILVGVVVPHSWAGFSGGAKLILPGISSASTINEHHINWFLHERSKAGILEGNVFREEIEEAARLAGVDYSLNIVTVKDTIVYSSWTRGLSSFKECVNITSRIFLKPIPKRKYDIVIADARPFDMNLYQATKAIDHAKLVIDRGGTIILVCECINGYGGIKEYLDMDERDIVEGLNNRAFRNLVPPLVALTLRKLQKSVKLYIVSPNISGGNIFEKIDLQELHGIIRNKKVLLLKFAGVTVPKIFS